MVDHIMITTFGEFKVQVDGEAALKFPSRKVEALLAYLAVEGQTLHRRESLCALLWPGMPERSARHNLRQILYALRQSFPDDGGEAGGNISLLLTDRQTVQLNPEAPVSVDIHRFDALLQHTQQHDHLNLAGCESCVLKLEGAVDLVQGNFLADLYLEDSNPFEDWAQAVREAYHRKSLEALTTLTDIHLQQAAYDQALASAERQLQMDPLREPAYRQLMEIHSKSGRRAEALRVYQRCQQQLKLELGTSPSRETTALFEIISGEDLQRPPITPNVSSIRGFQIREHLGSGHAGMVYRAFQAVINRDVAIKVILPQFANHPDFIRRFEVEAQLIARLEHPHIVPLYDYWRDPSGAYLVMRWLRGGNLQTALAQGPWKPLPAVTLVHQVADALSLAHHQGVVHCDIKPANILLDEANNAYLSDFGISILLEPLVQLSQDAAGGPVSSSGSLGYASPEVTRGQPASPLSDLYSLGVVTYEILTGRPPFPGFGGEALLVKHQTEPLPSVYRQRPDLPPAVDEVIQRATSKDPGERYQDVQTMAAAFRQALAPETVTVATVFDTSLDLRNPYKGLRPFQEADAADFYGREELVDRLLSRLKAGNLDPYGGRFMVLTGPSGSGKSSVVKAGLIPALRRGALPDSERWFLVEMTPGAHPMEELEAALLQIATEVPEDLNAQFSAEKASLVGILHRILPGLKGDVFLVVDQFEELYTLVEDPSERVKFLDLLAGAALDPGSPLRILITLRADFYDRPLQHVAFGELVRLCTEVVLPLSPTELERAICGPAEKVGVQVEGVLVAQMVQDVSDQPGALPLLQYALTELFENREGPAMTLETYEASGGVVGALGRRAEQIFTALDPDQQEATRQLFLRLVTLGEGTEDVRRRTQVAEMLALADLETLLSSLLETFGRYRLLTFDHDPVTRGPTVEVAHEALLREWQRLRDWLDESRADIRAQRLLAESVSDWETHRKDRGLLLRGTRLDQFLELSESNRVALTAGERAFLEASLAAREQRRQAEAQRQARETALEQRSRRNLRLLAAVFALAAVVALGLSWFAFNQQGIAQGNAATATVAQGQALIEAATAVAAQDEARHQAEIALAAQEQEAAQRALAEAAEAQAVRDRELAEEQRRIAVARELSSASLNSMAVDPDRSILLALEAVQTTYGKDGTVLLEAENALHQAIQASHIRLVLAGHQDRVAGVDYSPDGKYILTGSYDGTAKLWDAETGQEIRTFTGHTDVVFGVAFSPVGTRVATASYDATAKVWDVVSGQPLMTFSGHQGPINGVVFSPDGTHIATASLDATAKIWDVGTGKLLHTLLGHSDQVWHVEYTPDGTQLATVSVDGTARLWDAASGAFIKILAYHPALFREEITYDIVISRVTFSPDGRKAVLTGNHGLAQIVDVQTGEILLNLPNTGSNMTLWGKFSPDGSLVATTFSGLVRVFDASSGELRLELAGHMIAVGLDFSPDGTRLVSGGFEGVARVWELADGRELISIASEIGPFERFIRSSDGTLLAATINPNKALVMAADSGQVLYKLEKAENQDSIIDLAFSPDGAQIVTTSADASATVWDAANGRSLFDLTGHNLGEIQSDQKVRGILCVAYSPDSSRLASGGTDRTARIWDAKSGQELQVLRGHGPGPVELWGEGVHDLDFSPDGRHLVTGGADETVRLWDLETGKELLNIPAEMGMLINVRFTPDGAYLIATGNDGIAKVWDSGTGQERLTISSPAGRSINGVDVSSDSRFLVTSSGDGFLKVWDLQASLAAGTTIEVVTLAGDQMVNIISPQFNQDGTQVTAIRNGEIYFYVFDIDQLIALARSRVTRSFTEDECRQYLHLEACP